MSEDPFQPNEPSEERNHVSVFKRMPSLLWAFSPTFLLVASIVPGVDTYGAPSSPIGQVLFFLGLLGGPLIVLSWSIVAALRFQVAPWTKVLIALGSTVVMIVANLTLAGAGCAAVNFAR